MPESLSPLEKDILDYLADYVREHTYQPSVREIGTRFAIRSTKTVSEMLQSLADKGWIERDPSRSRGVRLLGLDLHADVVSVPHIDVHLSDPVLRDPLGSLSLDRRIVGSSACFMISMVGDNLRDSGIRDGDLLLVEPVAVDELEQGDLVAARSQGESMVRRFVFDGGQPALESGRLDTPPIPLNGSRGAEVMGRIIAVVRRLRTDAPAGMVARERSGQGATTA
jgi:repressor LexA